MSVENVWTGNDGEGVHVDGYVHEGGAMAILLSRRDVDTLTLTLHLSVNQARDIAAMLNAAAEAVASKRPCPRGVHSPGCHCGANVCDCDGCQERRPTPDTASAGGGGK